MTRYLQGVPTKSNIRAAVEHLFQQAVGTADVGVLSALIPVDTTMYEGHRLLSYVSDFEMVELCDFVGYFNGLIEAEADLQSCGRMQILVYCHIFEADFPLTTIWNLYRIIKGLQCEWTFFRTTRQGKIQVLKYPKGRLRELECLSKRTESKLGFLLAELWQNQLRNAFSHAQYFWTDDLLTCTGSLSPITRGAVGTGRNASKTFTAADLKDLYDGALAFIAEFVSQYKAVIRPFQDGNVYPLHGEHVQWDLQRKRWVWVDTGET